MNLQTWFKGLSVFVLSSLITAAATMTLDPTSFNLTKSGLGKVGAAALVIGVKAVLLYLKQSPLPNQQIKLTVSSKISGLLVCCVLLPATAMVTGCVSTWDQSTYASLAASKALIDCAVAGYNHFDADIRQTCAADPQDPSFDSTKFYLPQTHDAQQAVEKARQAQVIAVEAFAAYAVAKVGKDPAATLQEKQAAVVGYLAQLPALVSALRTLMSNTPASDLRAPVAIDRPLAAIAALRPAMEIR
jgi:hypothetical protein